MKEIRINASKKRTEAEATITAVAQTTSSPRAASTIASRRRRVALAIAAARII